MAPQHQEVMDRVMKKMKYPHEMIMNYLGKKFGSIATYEAKPPKQQENISPVDHAMNVLGYDPSKFSEKLSGYEKNILAAADFAKKQGYEITAPMLRTILSLESSALEDKTNRNPKIGEYAWVAGLTDLAKKDLQKMGFTPDFNSIQGALNAAAIYAGQRMSVYDYDPKTNTRTLNPITDTYKKDFGQFYANRYNAATSTEEEKNKMVGRANAVYNFFNQQQQGV